MGGIGKHIILYLPNWTSGKNTLAIENIVFAQTVVGFQKQFSSKLTELIQKIYLAIYLNTNEFNINYKNLLLALNSPRGITLSSYAENMNNLQTIINVMKEIGIDTKIIVNTFWPELYDQIIEADILIKQLNKQAEMEKIQQGGKSGNSEGDNSGSGGEMNFGGMDMSGVGGSSSDLGGDATTDSLEQLATSGESGEGGNPPPVV